MASSETKIANLNRDNFSTWKFQMKMHLIGKDLWDIVTGTEELPFEATPDEKEHFRKRNNKALSQICMHVEENLQIYLRGCSTGKEAWDILAGHFEEKTLSKKIFYRRKLYSIRLSNSTTMESHINAIRNIADHLDSLDNPISEDDLVMILLSSLSEDYNNLLTTLETLREDQLTWNYVRDRLITEYQRRKPTRSTPKPVTSQDGALLAGNYHNQGGNNRGRNSNHNNNNNRNNNRNNNNNANNNRNNNNTRNNNGNNNNNRNNQNNNNGQNQQPRFTMQCHNCREVGHLSRDCPNNNRNQNNAGGGGARGFSATASTFNPDVQPTFSPEFALRAGDESDNTWWIDSGATSHMNPDRDEFTSYAEFKEPIAVNLADDSFLLAPGSGSVPIRIYDVNQERNIDLVLENVLYVPDMQNKLFSIPAVTAKEGSVVLKKDSCWMEIGDRSFQIGTKYGKLYQLNNVPIEQSCFLGVHGKPLSLWHQRFGHLNCNDVKLLHDQNLVTGMSLSSCDKVDGCHGCALGKSTRNPFPKKSENKSTRPLQLIHSDVCGPIHVPSIGGSRYFVTFIDDYSRYVTVHLMKTKDESFDKFVEYVVQCENTFGVKLGDFELDGEMGVSLQKFRSDGGGEFVSNKFIDFCKARGIEKHLTVPYTPQQNGVAERMNRTLMEMTRSMLYHANLPQQLWAEAVSTAAYLKKLVPHVYVDERWCNKC